MSIDLLLKNEFLYFRRNEDEITHIMRTFNNYGARIEEDIQISETGDEGLLDLFNLEDFLL